jgi:hypothetical protein
LIDQILLLCMQKVRGEKDVFSLIIEFTAKIYVKIGTMQYKVL